MKFSTTLAAAACALALIGPAAAAESVTAEDAPLVNDTIEVVAARPEQVQSFVSEVVVEPKGADALARWTRKLCVGVSGLDADKASYVADAVSGYAQEVGLKTGKPGCTANLSVVFTNDGKAMAQGIKEQKSSILAINKSYHTKSGSRADLDRFLNSEIPVRWWYVTNTVDRMGNVVEGDAFTDGSGIKNAPVVRSYSATRLKSPVREDMSHAIVIVDVSKIEGMQLDSISEYLAMVSLAQISPEADVSALPSILNLFEDNPTALNMTDWDLAFLKALYNSEGRSMSINSEKRTIASQMRKGS